MDVLYYIAIIAMSAADFWLWLICGLVVIIVSGWLYRRRRRFSSLVWSKLFLAVIIVAHIAGGYLGFMGVYQFWYTHRPIPTPEQRILFDGISYIRDVRSNPRPLVIHVVQIQLDTPGISFLVTPGDPTREYPLTAQTTSQFLSKYSLQLAINGDFFEPWWSNGIFDYYPHVGDVVSPLGVAVSQGTPYSEGRENHPTLSITQDNHLSLEFSAVQIFNAISGSAIILKDGEFALPDREAYLTDLHPRTAIGWNKRGDTLIIVVVDGRQPNYSEGVSLQELAGMMLDYRADIALNLDGGGSSTLVMESASGEPVVLNSPIDQRIPGRERPVANHLGIFATNG